MAIDIGFPDPHLLTHGNSVRIVQPNHAGDEVYYSERPGLPGNQISLVFAAAPHVTWWKGLEVLDESGQVLEGLYTQDQEHGPIERAVTLDGRDPNRLSLMLLKARAFGAHTGMYRIAGLGQKAGMTLNFYWQKD